MADSARIADSALVVSGGVAVIELL